jgi:hypothetical protein
MTKQNPHRYAEALKNTAAVAKAERYEAWLKSRNLPVVSFARLADQAMAWNDFRILEMVYMWAEFESRQRSEGDEL